jgi:hypothetical protein
VADTMAASCGAQSAPDSITDADIAFLKGLYATQGDVLGSTERVDVARRMAQGLSGQ